MFRVPPETLFHHYSTIEDGLGSEYASELSVEYFFSNFNDQSTNVLNQKTNVSSMSKYFVHIEINAELKNVGGREVVKNSKKIGRQSSKLKHLLK